MTQSHTLQRLREDHGVGWGVKKLRQVGAVVSAAMTNSVRKRKWPNCWTG